MLGSIFSGICFSRKFCLKGSLASKATFCMYRQIKIFYYDYLDQYIQNSESKMADDPISFFYNKLRHWGITAIIAKAF